MSTHPPNPDPDPPHSPHAPHTSRPTTTCTYKEPHSTASSSSPCPPEAHPWPTPASLLQATRHNREGHHPQQCMSARRPTHRITPTHLPFFPSPSTYLPFRLSVSASFLCFHFFLFIYFSSFSFSVYFVLFCFHFFFFLFFLCIFLFYSCLSPNI
ncbi:hypothetical protein E2C01_089995 [Portunus trituberculatus]|uniref:Uncharacterized protein n=1 Tax=Portunus trituberculatus TaxID=210409 RepID=A0A5B7JJ36_PORTR|nr:hypothetical protein [Portunus trituberculatus]